MQEDEVYLLVKDWLQDRGWKILGGEPPNGTNVIPRLYIKDANYQGKGSKGSKKIDIVTYKNGYFLLIEVKPTRSRSDEKKLNEIVSEKKWREAFINALKERRSFPEGALAEETYVEQKTYLVKTLAYDIRREEPLDDFIHIFVNPLGEISISFGYQISQEIRALFR